MICHPKISSFWPDNSFFTKFISFFFQLSLQTSICHDLDKQQGDIAILSLEVFSQLQAIEKTSKKKTKDIVT